MHGRVQALGVWSFGAHRDKRGLPHSSCVRSLLSASSSISSPGISPGTTRISTRHFHVHRYTEWGLLSRAVEESLFSKRWGLAPESSPLRSYRPEPGQAASTHIDRGKNQNREAASNMPVATTDTGDLPFAMGEIPNSFGSWRGLQVNRSDR
jgi:hypothetical protein